MKNMTPSKNNFGYWAELLLFYMLCSPHNWRKAKRIVQKKHGKWKQAA